MNTIHPAWAWAAAPPTQGLTAGAAAILGAAERWFTEDFASGLWLDRFRVPRDYERVIVPRCFAAVLDNRHLRMGVELIRWTSYEFPPAWSGPDGVLAGWSDDAH
jgi:hypothetical protein